MLCSSWAGYRTSLRPCRLWKISLALGSFINGKGCKKAGSNDDGSTGNHAQAGDFVKKKGGKHDAVEGLKTGDYADCGGPEVFQGRDKHGVGKGREDYAKGCYQSNLFWGRNTLGYDCKNG